MAEKNIEKKDYVEFFSVKKLEDGNYCLKKGSNVINERLSADDLIAMLVVNNNLLLKKDNDVQESLSSIFNLLSPEKADK